MKGQCVLSSGPCPEGFKSEGVGGIRLTQGNTNPFKEQAQNDVRMINELLQQEEAGYSFITPTICCATSDEAKMGENTFVFARSCPGGNSMQSGILWDLSNYKENPFEFDKKDAESYDKKRVWLHPYICPVKTVEEFVNAQETMCMLSGECNAQLSPYGPAALLVDGQTVRERSATQYPFEIAPKSLGPVGEFAWVRPKLCCNRKHDGSKAVEPTQPNDGSTLIADSYVPTRNTQCKNQFQWQDSYGFMFWVNPSSIFQDWSNLFHKGEFNVRRSPAVWFYPNSLRIHFRSATKLSAHENDWTGETNNGLDPEQQMQIGKWTHVAFTHYEDKMEVYYDGELVAKQVIGRPVPNNGQFVCPCHLII